MKVCEHHEWSLLECDLTSDRARDVLETQVDVSILQSCDRILQGCLVYKPNQTCAVTQDIKGRGDDS